MSDWDKLCEEVDLMIEKLEASQEALEKTFNKLADEQQKLEVIWGIISDNCRDILTDKCPCTECDVCLMYHLKEAFRVLGVLKEMQKENQVYKHTFQLIKSAGGKEVQLAEKLVESEALLQLANTRLNVLAKQLGETQDEVRFYRSECNVAVKRANKAESMNETLNEYAETFGWFEASIMKKKLEAIRGWYGHQVGKQVDPQDIVELGKLLGVLEMQEKE